jgi:putative peptidoglycan lipid II flippase
MLANLRIVSLGTVVSRILGLLRDMGMLFLFGQGTIQDAFVLAFRIPNLTRQLLGEGALSTAFLPVFIRNREQYGTQTARATLTAVALIVTLILISVIVLGELCLFGIWTLLEPSESTRLLLLLLAILLPYMLLICLAALFCAALHAQRQFVWPAVVPIVLNTVWLAGIGIVGCTMTHPIRQVLVLSFAILVAGALQLWIPLRALQRLRMGLVLDWRAGWPYVADIFRAMIPVLIGMSILQVSTIFDSLLAYGLSRPDLGGPAWSEAIGIEPLLESGTASALYIGQRMYQFPLGVFGVALGTVLYPVLTQHAQRGEMDLLRTDLARGIRIVIAIAIPASAGLCLVAWPLTVALFWHGEFNADDARLTSRMIAVYGTGVWSYIGLAILNRAFYATGDRQTPMRLGLLSLSLNVILNLTLIWKLGGVGLALGSVLANGIQVLVTLWKLNQRVGPLDWPSIRRTLGKGLFATALMTLACLAGYRVLPAPESAMTKLLLLGTPCLIGGLVYLATAKLCGMTELDDLVKRS